MVDFRKRLTAERVSDINERILASRDTLISVDSKKEANAKTDSKKSPGRGEFFLAFRKSHKIQIGLAFK